MQILVWSIGMVTTDGCFLELCQSSARAVTALAGSPIHLIDDGPALATLPRNDSWYRVFFPLHLGDAMSRTIKSSVTRVATVSGVVDANLTCTTWCVVNSATELISLNRKTKTKCR